MAKEQEKQSAEQQLARVVMDLEVETAKSNTEAKVAEMELSIDMLEAERTEKEYDWMSDIYIPEFASQMLTQSSNEADQYFQTREFVEVYIEDESPEIEAKAKANQELINRTLNQRHLNHYQKFMRANINKNVTGEVYIKCGWERTSKIKKFIVPDIKVNEDFSVEELEQEIEKPVIDKDRFNYDILDRRNVFTDNKYVYSLQEKDWITIREEKTLSELETDAQTEGYINLDKLKEVPTDVETLTSSESYNKDDQDAKVERNSNMPYDIYHRYGKYWAIVKERDKDNNPTPLGIELGIDEFGKPMDKAELVECIISYAVSGSTRQLIRFIAQPFIDAVGNPYRPLIRGICYIHPTKDMGLGDGRYSRELQMAINDTFNVSNDRVMLSTMPTLKGRKYALEDNATVYFEPGHTMELENPDDVVEFKITDNITGALQQISQLKQSMSGVTSIFPPSLGSVPEIASTTATAVAGAEQNKNLRSNYRAMTFEHTLLNPLYWMITQMTWQFATGDTAIKLLGSKLENFDPTSDFTYKPLSQSIESEYSKANQVRELNQMLGYLAPTVQINPKAVTLINFIIARIFTLFGDEYAKFGQALLDPNGQLGQPGQPTNANSPTQNQTGLPQGVVEQGVRA